MNNQLQESLLKKFKIGDEKTQLENMMKSEVLDCMKGGLEGVNDTTQLHRFMNVLKNNKLIESYKLDLETNALHIKYKIIDSAYRLNANSFNKEFNTMIMIECLEKSNLFLNFIDENFANTDKLKGVSNLSLQKFESNLPIILDKVKDDMETIPTD